MKSVELKGGRCVECNESDPAVLQFHHTGEKRFSLSTVFGDPLVSWEAIAEELEQTTLLCSNDHLRFHAKQRRDAWNRKQSEIPDV